MPKTLADGHILGTWIPESKATGMDIKALTVTDLAKGIKASCRIMKSDYAAGPTGSSTIDEVELCKVGQGQEWGMSAYAVSLTVFRYLDADGKADATADEVFAALGEKGKGGIWVEREGPAEDVAWAEGQEYSAFQCTTDDPQPPSDRTSGYIKRTIPMSDSNAALNKLVVAGN